MVVAPESYSFYDSINQTSRSFFQTSGNAVESYNNLFEPYNDSELFEDINGTSFSPAFGSGAVDSGSQTPFFFLQADYIGNSRIQRYRSDAGSVESPYFSSGINDAEEKRSYTFDNPLRRNEWLWKFRGFSTGEVAITLIDNKGIQVLRTTIVIEGPDSQFFIPLPRKLASEICGAR